MKNANKILVLSLFVLAMLSTIVSAESFRLGDVNHDHRITMTDAYCVRDAVMLRQPTCEFMENGDMNGDGLITMIDYSMVMDLAKKGIY
ncbi:hypothetical protein HY643_05350 [Candidatus Woesearchaeota archaeon]|nr:hypothetical protein [Candidatus Woesearchaeota archaeon]